MRGPRGSGHGRKQRNHSHSLLGKAGRFDHLSIVRTDFWPTGRTPTQPAKTKENPYEEAHYRRRARRCLCQPRFGRRFPERLHDPLNRVEIDGQATITLFSPMGTSDTLVPISFCRTATQNGKKRTDSAGATLDTNKPPPEGDGSQFQSQRCPLRTRRLRYSPRRSCRCGCLARCQKRPSGPRPAC